MVDFTSTEQRSFQLFSMPARFPGNGYSPEYRAFPKIAKVDICGGRANLVLIKVPATTSAIREPGEVYLWRRDILDHRMETNQCPIGVNVRRIVEREWWDLSSKHECWNPRVKSHTTGTLTC
jgi:hypothetical protein